MEVRKRIKSKLAIKSMRKEFKGELALYRQKYFEKYGRKLNYKLNAQLHDKTEDTGFDAHYVYQGPWVMRGLTKSSPKKHIDVGSWLPYIGFFAAKQPTEFVDIRPAKLDIPGVSTKKGSVLDLPYKDRSVESLSCLHVIEHIGLGRYGDPLDVEGTIKAAKELCRVIAKGGSLYVSLPIGKEMTYFNAHRVTDPVSVVGLFADLQMVSFSAITDQGKFKSNIKPSEMSGQQYACGLYHFTRP